MRASRLGNMSRYLAMSGAAVGALGLSTASVTAATCSGDPPCLERLVEREAGGKYYIDVHFKGACKFDVFTLWVANRSSVRFTDPSKGHRNELCSSRPYRYGPVEPGQKYSIAINGCVRRVIGKDNCTWPPSAALSLVIKGRAGALPYGPDTCKQGFVWREVTPSDHVCVTPQTRDEVRRDNAQAAARRQPGGGAYGPNTCRQGFVWREAVAGDHVCVVPAVRDKARRDNALAAQRRVRG
jgi:hypothetical protein